MIELSLENAAAYLAGRGMPGATITELDGGVSNTVLRADGVVLKQALGKLRVEQDWFSERTRVLREAAALDALAGLDAVPRLVFLDRDNLILGMTAAPEDSVRWKDQLLAGDISVETAARAGSILGRMITSTANHPEGFDDLTVFDQLRLDPYYRAAAVRLPDLRKHFERRILDCQSRRVSLVHGDYSPKNLLVAPGSVIAIDFECVHWGDPSFDTAFLINHLLMKSLARPQWRDRYRAAAIAFFAEARVYDWLEAATIEHLGCLLAARVDGKSPAEYLDSPGLREIARGLARSILNDPPGAIGDCFA